jgi:hypothetical protein
MSANFSRQCSHRIVILPAPACRGRRCDFIDIDSIGFIFCSLGAERLTDLSRDAAQWRDLLFPSSHPIQRPLIKVTTLHLSSRAQPRDLRCAPAPAQRSPFRSVSSPTKSSS